MRSKRYSLALYAQFTIFSRQILDGATHKFVMVAQICSRPLRAYRKARRSAADHPFSTTPPKKQNGPYRSASRNVITVPCPETATRLFGYAEYAEDEEKEVYQEEILVAT